MVPLRPYRVNTILPFKHLLRRTPTASSKIRTAPPQKPYSCDRRPRTSAPLLSAVSIAFTASFFPHRPQVFRLTESIVIVFPSIARNLL